MQVSVTMKSMISGITRTREFEMTETQLSAYQQRKECIQNIFPEFSADDREFLMTGITSEEWDAMFGSSFDQDEDYIEATGHKELPIAMESPIILPKEN